MVRLTEKQKSLIRVIEGFQLLGQVPTRSELARVRGVSSPAITKMLQTLEKKGVVSIGRGWRSIKLIEMELE